MNRPFAPGNLPSSLSRRDFLKTAGGLAALGLASRYALSDAMAAVEATGKKPNLVFVFSDQQSWDMMGCYGNDQIYTPNFDAFAKEAVQFNDCISNSPVCSPWRGTFLTGQHPLYHGVIRNGHDLISEPGTRLGHVLQKAGYKTAYVGKWHLLGGDVNRPVPAGPDRHGFDQVFLTNNCCSDFRPGKAFYYDQDSGEKIIFDEWEQVGQTRQAMEFLDTCTPEDPFALVLSWHPPHNHVGPNYFAPKEWEEMYPLEKIRVRPDATDQADNILLREYQGHMGLVTSIDDCFGKLMAKLKQKGLDENTIVVFTADHGDMMRYVPGGKHGNPKDRLFKSMAQPTASHIPLLIRYPGHLKPRQSGLLFDTINLMPTLLGMMDLPIPENAQGKDLTAAIQSGDDHAVSAIPLCLFSGRGWRGVTTRDHVYACEILDEDWREALRFRLLIDRKQDPYALKNMFNHPDQRDLQEELHKQTLRLMAGFGDEGWDYGQLVNATLVNPADAKKSNLPGVESRNKGRPIDCMRAAGVRGKFADAIEKLS